MMRALSTAGLVLMALILLGVALTPAAREKVLGLVPHANRQILATTDGDVLNDGHPVKVVKLRDEGGLFVEIVGQSLVERLRLPDRHDGLMNVRGRVTRLAIMDVDGDGKNELVAPSFDNQLVPHLNVFRYNPALARFEPVQPGPPATE